MADTAISITAGSGTNVDTRTEGTNGNHRQVIVIGDPATNAGVAPVDATNGLAVDIKQSVALDVSAATVTVDLGANNDVIATGNVAHDAADSGNPVKFGGKADTTTPAAVADGDRVDAHFDPKGNQVIRMGPSLTYTSIDKTTTAAQDIVAAPGAGNHLRIFGYTISNEGTEQVTVTITNVASFNVKDGSSINMVLPGYVDIADNTACQATLSGTSTNGIVIGVYHETIAT